MTEKQERIIQSALQLFAECGYDATSTSKVAKAAGVSEGLIFRHFGNKEGLLNAIMELGAAQAMEFYGPILNGELQGEKALAYVFELPFSIGPDQYHFWRLLYALKWQADEYDATMTAPILAKLTEVLNELGYDDPNYEAQTVLLILDGIATTMILHPPAEPMRLLAAIKRKYHIESTTILQLQNQSEA